MGEGLGSSKIETPGHLEKGVSPIIFDVLSFQDLSKEARVELENKFDPTKFPKVHDAKWEEGNVEGLLGMGFLTGGKYTYVISPLDDYNKTSDGFIRCTSLVVAGKDAKTGRDVSFVTHQDPVAFLRDYREGFLRDLRTRLREVTQRCKLKTVDAVILGGRYLKDAYLSDEEAKQAYIDSVELLGEEVRGALGFVPLVKGGPKVTNGKDKDGVFYDNNARKGYLIRPTAESGSRESFLASEVRKHAEGKKWG